MAPNVTKHGRGKKCLQSHVWRTDCVLLPQRCRSHVFHVIDDVRDMRSRSTNNKPRHKCSGEEMKWCRVWECWDYARAEICIVERELSKSVIGCSSSVGYQLNGRCLSVGADALLFVVEDAECGMLLSRLMMSFSYFKGYYSSVPRLFLRSFWHMKSCVRLQLHSGGYWARSQNLYKATIFMSARPHGTFRLQLDGFS